MSIRPLHDRVVVKRVEAKKKPLLVSFCLVARLKNLM